MNLKLKCHEWLRSQSGFSLPTVVCLGVAASLVLFSTAQLLTISSAKISRERLTDTLRASAEAGLDWAVAQMGNSATRTAIDTSGAAKSTVIPADFMQDTSYTGYVTVESVAAPSTSYLYSTQLDSTLSTANIVGGNGWRVLTATVTNGIKSKSVRVILKPTYTSIINTSSMTSTSTATSLITSTSTTLVNGQPTPLFTKSMFGKGAITFNGKGAKTDSYNSTTDPTASNLHTTGSAAKGDVGSNMSVSVGNGTVGGSVTVTAGSGAGSVSVGAQGSVAGTIQSSGTISGASGTANTGAAQQTLPDVPTAPSNALTTQTTTTLPDLTNVTSSVSLASIPQTSPGVYDIKVSSLKVSGQGKITFPSSGIVNIYVEGAGASINIAGNGFVQSNNIPSNVRIWYSGSGSVSVGGNGVMKAVIYAPSATVSFSGNGSFYGAVIGNTISVNGGGNSPGVFHYDEALGTTSQITYTPKVTSTVINSTVTTSVITTTNVVTTTVNNIDKFQAVSWMEF